MSFFSIKKNGEEVDISLLATKDVPLTPSGHVDVDEIIRRHKILEQAREDGENEEPKSNLTKRVASERHLDDLMNQYSNCMRDNTVSNVKNYDSAFEQAKNEAEVALDEIMLSSVRAQTNSLLEPDDVTVLEQHRKKFTDAQTTFENFRAVNDLTRPPQETSKTAMALRLVILFLFVCAEGVINAAIFGSNLDGGLIAGFATAFGASLANVGAAALGAYFLTRYLMVPGAKHIWGWVGVVVNFVTIFGLSLVIAHYRDALQIDEDNATSLAFQSLLHHTFDMSDIVAWALFGVSILFGLLAVLDVWKFKDPFPGYHEANVTYQDALDEWAAVCDEFREKLANKRDEFIRKFDENLEKAKADASYMERRLKDKESEIVKYHSVADNAVTVLHALIGKYREANRAARTTPPPIYFEEYDDISYPQLDDIACTDPKIQEEQLAKLKAAIQSLRSEARERKADILRRFNEENEKLFNVDEI